MDTGRLIPTVAAGLMTGLALAPLLAQTQESLRGLQISGGAGQVSTEAGTGTIGGVIRDGGTGAPLAGAIVYLGPPQHGPPGAPIRQLTDSQGRFRFTRLPAFGGYFIQVTMAGYFTGYYGGGSSMTSGSRLALEDDQIVGDADVALEKYAVVTGRVLDERNEPVVGVFVRVLPRVFVAGQSRIAAGPAAGTDDRGVYRIGGLPSGSYVVHVPIVIGTVPASVFDPTGDARPGPARQLLDPSPSQRGRYRIGLRQYATPLPPVDGRLRAYPGTFHPAASSLAQAPILELEAGEQREGVDIQLTPVETFIVTGRLIGPANAVAGVTMRLIPPGAETLGFGAEAATTISEPDGTFTFYSVPRGAYSLIAHDVVTQYQLRFDAFDSSPNLPTPPGVSPIGISTPAVFSGPPRLFFNSRGHGGNNTWRGMVPLQVEGDTADVSVPMTNGVTLSGRFVWDDPASEARGYPNLIRLEPADGDPTLGVPAREVRGTERMTADRFEVSGLLAGRYLLTVTLPNTTIKSIEWNGRDHTNLPFDASSGSDIAGVVVTLTTQQSFLRGSVRDEGGTIPEDAAVIVFPAEQDQWASFGFQPDRIKSIQMASDGRFAFQSLTAGDYLAVAVDADDIDAWQQPGFLSRAARVAARFTMDWGATTVQNLRLVEVGR